MPTLFIKSKGWRESWPSAQGYLSVSLGMISALELGSYAISHHKDPATAEEFSLALTFILLVGGIVGFMTAVWRVEAKARRELTAK
jgi:hypothetical protein